MEEPISVGTDGPVAVVRIMRGKANALDTGLCRAITARLGEVVRDGARAIVLTGEGSSFSAGVDLLSIAGGGPEYVAAFLPALTDAFMAVFGCSIPVVAAVNGHAIAGGCILVSACDHRVMNAGHGRIGVTELLVGVPFPPAALEILRFAAGTQRLAELTYFGRTYPAADALALGLIDETAEADRVLPRALEVAHTLAAVPAESLRHTRQQIRGPALERIARGDAAAGTASEIWRSPEVQQSIRGYIERVLRRG